MDKFIVTIDTNSAAKQVANLLNNNNKLITHYTSSKVLGNNTSYCLEYGGFNERIEDGSRKVIGVVGYACLSEEATLIKHLCVDNAYRNKGIATSLIKKAICNCSTPYIQMHVRSDNNACLHLTERLGFVYIYHKVMSNYHILVLGREKSVTRN